MADNTDLNLATSAGDKVVTREISHGGDTAKLQGVFAMGISGTEGSYTAAAIGGDSANGLDVDVTRVSGNVTVVDGGGSLTVDGTVELGATTLAALESLTVDGTVELGATTLSALETINAAQSGNWTARVADGSGNALTSKAPGSERALSVAIVDGAGNQVTSFGGSGGTSATDDAAFTAASGSGTPMMAFATADSVDSGDVGVVAMTTARAMHVAVQGTVTVSDGSGSLTVDGTVELGATSLAALETIELGATSLAALESLTTINAVTTVGTITNAVTVVGSAAEDAAASGNPVLVGGRYDSSARTLETGDVGALAVNASGQLLVEIAAGAGSGGTSAADGATFTRNTTSITPVGAVVETSAPTLTNGDVAGLSQTTAGALRVAVTSGGVAGVVEDAAAAGGEEGVLILAVRRDSASSGVSADGDFAALSVTSDGSLRVSGGGGGTQYAVDTASGGTDTGTLSLAVRDDVLATLTPVDGDYTQLRTNARGAQWVCLDSTAAQTVTLAASTATQEIVGDAATDAAVSGNPVYIAGRGNNSTPTAMSAANDVTPFWLTLTGAQVVAGDTNDDAAFTPGSGRVQAIGFFADETATDSVDEGDIGAARITLDRKQIVANYAHAAGGATPGRLVSAASTNGTVVKASAGTLYALVCMNLNAAVRYLKVYNSASVTVGTTTPTWTFPIPASTTGAGFNVPIPDCGIAFGTGICLGITTGIADNDTGAVAANEIVVNYAYV